MSIDIDQENNTKNKMVLHENIDCVEQYVDESNTGQSPVALSKEKKRCRHKVKSSEKSDRNVTEDKSYENIDLTSIVPTCQENRLINDFVQEYQNEIDAIIDYAQEPLLSLNDACQSLVDIIHDILVYAQMALDETPNEPPDGLTIDESAAIRLYTMEWEETCQSLYSKLNRTLKIPNHEDLRPYNPYLKLFLTAVVKLPCQVPQTVWRGVTKNLSNEFTPGTLVTWWGFSSCTISLTVLENQLYLGTIGARTLFSIETINARSICNHSHFVTEDEVLLLPGTYMEVQSQFSPAPDLHVVHLKQIKPERMLIALPFEGAQLYRLEPEKKPWYKKKRTIIELICIVILCIVGISVGAVFAARKSPIEPVCIPHRTGIRADLFWSFDCADAREDHRGIMNGTAINDVNYVESDLSVQGKALALDLFENQYILLPYSLNLTLNTSFTISVWMFRTGYGNQSLISDCNRFTKTCFVVMLISRTIRIELVSAQNGTIINQKLILIEGHMCQSCWIYFSLIFNQTQKYFTFYMNGIIIGRCWIDLNVVLQERLFNESKIKTYIGVNALNLKESFTGLLDQLSVAYDIKNSREILTEASLLRSYRFDSNDVNQDSSTNQMPAINQNIQRVTSDNSTSVLINETDAYFGFSGMKLLKSTYHQNSIAFWLRVSYDDNYQANEVMALMQLSLVYEGILSSIYLCAMLVYIELDTHEIILFFPQNYLSVIVNEYKLEEDTWTHIGIAFAYPNELIIYINGQKLNKTVSVPFDTMIIGSSDLSILFGFVSTQNGTSDTSIDNKMVCSAEIDNLNYIQMNGQIDDVMIFARALNNTEFASLSAYRGASLNINAFADISLSSLYTSFYQTLKS